ncbi:MAG: SAM-dependent DNA methyltransferase, partial [Sedimentisphaerales bacterium]|nr:SAM-dependent DNA methyltransferase [Sedimentisphaerales bacterium]
PEQMKETPGRHIKRVLDPYVYKGYWYDDAWLAFVRWLLHGFGRRGLEEDVERIPEDVRDKWYTEFNLAYLLAVPADWSAWLLQGGPRWMKQKGARWAKSSGFFSTPMNVGKMMAQMLFLGEEDARLKTVCDPCCGTGSLLLLASNHSLRLYGQDVVYDLCLCAEINGWLYAPWLVCMPPLVSTMFEMRTQRAMPLVPPIRFETDPARVEATRAYRAGELGQADFFDQVGVSTIEEQRVVYEALELEPAFA